MALCDRRTAFLVRALVANSDEVLSLVDMVIDMEEVEAPEEEGAGEEQEEQELPLEQGRKEMLQAAKAAVPFVSVAFDSDEAIRYVEWYLEEKSILLMDAKELGLPERAMEECYLPDESSRKQEGMVRVCEPVVLVTSTSLEDIDGFLVGVFSRGAE